MQIISQHWKKWISPSSLHCVWRRNYVVIRNFTEHGGKEEWEKLRELNEHFKHNKEWQQIEGKAWVHPSCENLWPIWKVTGQWSTGLGISEKVPKTKLFALQKVSTLSLQCGQRVLALGCQSPACSRAWGAQHPTPGMEQELLAGGSALAMAWGVRARHWEGLLPINYNVLICMRGYGINPSISAKCESTDLANTRSLSFST